jgi:hypothetical protein
LARNLLVVAGLLLAIRLVGLPILGGLVVAGLWLPIILAWLALGRNWLVIVSLRRRPGRFGASIFKLAYALTHTTEQLWNALGTKKQHQNEDNEYNRLWVAEEKEGDE